MDTATDRDYHRCYAAHLDQHAFVVATNKMSTLSASNQRSPVADPTGVMQVEFYVLVGNEPVHVSVNHDDNLVKLFAGLREHPIASKLIPTRATPSNCSFYRLKNPLLFSQPEVQEGGAFLRHAKRQCKNLGNRSRVEPITTTVGLLAQPFSRDHAYLVIELPDPFLDMTKELRENHTTLFECLQVTVRSLGAWASTDVEANLEGGTLTKDITTLPITFGEIQNDLAQPRRYQTSNAKDNMEFEMALLCKTQFERVFIPVESASNALVHCREFGAFYHVLRGFNEDVLKIAGCDSPALKANSFAIHFLQPPFWHHPSQCFKYTLKMSWDFPIFVDAAYPPNAFRKFVPKNYSIVFSPQFDIPFLICEVVTDLQNDRSRVLVQATAVARAGHFLLRSTSRKKFFVVAIYLDADMVVSRYIVMQTEGGDSESGPRPPVSIHEQCFDLRNEDEQVDFLKEMYNLAAQIDALSDELDPAKKSDLHAVCLAAGGVISLPNDGNTRDDMHPTSGGSAFGFQDGGDLGVFDAEEIQTHLRQMNYKIEFIPHGHPHLAVTVSKTGEKGYLKFVEREREVGILKYLAGIQSPSNHTVPDIQFWPVEGATVISMPVAGGWLTSLKNRDEQLWSVALQFVEAVAFMHEHNVAHMDLKPRNVIIPPEGGRLSIIDFSVSIRVRSSDARYKGVVGTEDYIAPEVREGWYKPMLADLWSCGKTLEEFCSGCHTSADCTTLLQISKRLMNRDPEVRPKMSAVLEWMASPEPNGGSMLAPRTSPSVRDSDC